MSLSIVMPCYVHIAMSLSIVMPCYVHIAMSLSIVTSQCMSLALLLPIVVPQWGHPLQHHDPLCCHNESRNIKVVQVVNTGVISTRDQGYGDHVKTSHGTA